MDHELAKQLKDAGFPQIGSKWKFLKEGMECEIYPSPIGVKEPCYCVPTLEKLIEACGHVRLDYFPKGNSFANCCDRPHHKQTGKTPEEAVANLYLALNKSSEQKKYHDKFCVKNCACATLFHPKN